MQTNYFDGQIKMEVIDAQNEQIKISMIDDNNICWCSGELILQAKRNKQKELLEKWEK